MIEKIHWTQKRKGKYSSNLHPSMLTEEGYETPFVGKLQGRGVTAVSITCYLHFDKSYVFKFIQRKIISTLMIYDKQQFLDLMSEAWDYHKEDK